MSFNYYRPLFWEISYLPCTPGPHVTQGYPSASAVSSVSGRSHGTCVYRRWASPQWKRWAEHQLQWCQWLLCCWADCRTWCVPHLGKTRYHRLVPCDRRTKEADFNNSHVTYVHSRGFFINTMQILQFKLFWKQRFDDFTLYQLFTVMVLGSRLEVVTSGKALFRVVAHKTTNGIFIEFSWM